MALKYCIKCGNKLDEKTGECPNCGYKKGKKIEDVDTSDKKYNIKKLFLWFGLIPHILAVVLISSVRVITDDYEFIWTASFKEFFVFDLVFFFSLLLSLLVYIFALVLMNKSNKKTNCFLSIGFSTIVIIANTVMSIVLTFALHEFHLVPSIFFLSFFVIELVMNVVILIIKK